MSNETFCLILFLLTVGILCVWGAIELIDWFRKRGRRKRIDSIIDYAESNIREGMRVKVSEGFGINLWVVDYYSHRTFNLTFNGSVSEDGEIRYSRCTKDKDIINVRLNSYDDALEKLIDFLDE